MSSGGDIVSICGLPPRAALATRCGRHACAQAYVPRTLTASIRSTRFIGVASVPVRPIALALLTRMSMPPKRATPSATAAATIASSRMSHATASAWPPAASIAAAAEWIVPGRRGFVSVVLAATITLAPSRAARSAIARPMPRDAPVTNSVLPASVRIASGAEFGTPLGEERGHAFGEIVLRAALAERQRFGVQLLGQRALR